MRPTSTLPDPDAGLGRRLPTPEAIDSAAHAAQAIAVAMEVDGGLKVTGAARDPLRIAPAVGERVIELLGHMKLSHSRAFLLRASICCRAARCRSTPTGTASASSGGSRPEGSVTGRRIIH